MTRPETDFQKCVRIGYECGTPPGEIASLLGSTTNSVKVTAHKIGVSDRPIIANLKRRKRRGLA